MCVFRLIRVGRDLIWDTSVSKSSKLIKKNGNWMGCDNGILGGQSFFVVEIPVYSDQKKQESLYLPVNDVLFSV